MGQLHDLAAEGPVLPEQPHGGKLHMVRAAGLGPAQGPKPVHAVLIGEVRVKTPMRMVISPVRTYFGAGRKRFFHAAASGRSLIAGQHFIAFCPPAKFIAYERAIWKPSAPGSQVTIWGIKVTANSAR